MPAFPTQAFSLMYHDVVEPGGFGASGISGADADLYKLEQAEFRRHLDAIAEVAGSRVGVCMGSAAAPPPVFLTFDDGGASSLWTARELETRGWRGHFFITTDWIGKQGFVTAEDLRAMQAAGHVIGSHSASHPLRLSGLERGAIAREWRESVRALADILGEAVTVASVPGGFYSREVGETAAEAGIRTLFTSEPTEDSWTLLDRAQRTANGGLSAAGDCRMLGRYFVQRGMAAEMAASFAGGPAGPRRKQRMVWTLKKAAKAVGGDLYVRARVAMLAKRGN